MEFKDGDIAEFGGVRGVVRLENLDPYCVVLHSLKGNGVIAYFTTDGRFAVSHTKPLLILIERPKRKVKKQLKGYVNVYRDGSVGAIHSSRESANTGAGLSRIDCVELTGEYEVEE